MVTQVKDYFSRGTAQNNMKSPTDYNWVISLKHSLSEEYFTLNSLDLFLEWLKQVERIFSAMHQNEGPNLFLK